MDSVSSESWDVEVRRVYPNDGAYGDTWFSRGVSLWLMEASAQFFRVLEIPIDLV